MSPAFPIEPARGGPRVIMTTMKNEGPFLLEWVAHNLSIGFSGFVVFTNDCSDGTDLIAQRLDELGFCSHRPNPIIDDSPPQHKALRRAMYHPWVQQAEWLMCLDVDEFLNLREGLTSLDELLAKIGDCDALSIAWKLFGCGGVDAYEDVPVTRQFLLADLEGDPANGRATGFKTLFRNNGTFNRFNPHRPKVVPDDKAGHVRWSDPGGNHKPMAEVGWRAWRGFSHKYARLHHYSVRSLESFLVKRDRGRTNHIAREQAEHYWSDMNVNRVSDETILPHADHAQPMLAALKEDPVLSRLHEQACQWHRDKITELKSLADWTDFREWLKENKLQTNGLITQRDY